MRKFKFLELTFCHLLNRTFHIMILWWQIILPHMVTRGNRLVSDEWQHAMSTHFFYYWDSFKFYSTEFIIYFMKHNSTFSTMYPIYWHSLTSIPPWIINHLHNKVWDEITFPFPNFNDCTVEVWKGEIICPTFCNGCNFLSMNIST